MAALGADAGELRRLRGELAGRLRNRRGFAISESPTYVARGVAAVAPAGAADRWKASIVSARQLADAYGVTDTDGSRPDCWGHLAAYGWEHADGGGIDEFR